MAAQKIRIGTLNCGGFRKEKTKRKLIFDLARENQIDILILQETNIQSQEEKKIKIEWGGGPTIFSASHENAPFSGVAIFGASPEIQFDNPIYDSEGKLIATDVSARGDKFRIVNVHLPQTPNLSSFEPILTELHALMQSPLQTILGGDFNFVEDPTTDRHPIPRRDRASYLQTPWEHFKQVYNISDIIQNNNQKEFTREEDGVFSRIDRFYTTPNIQTQNIQVKHVGVSDHRLLRADFNFDRTKKRGKGRFKCNAKVHERPDFLQEVEVLTEQFQDHETYISDPPEWWKNYKKKVARIYTKHAKLRTREQQEQQKLLEIGIEQTENRLHQNPTNFRLKIQYQNAKNDLKTFLLNKTKEKMVKERYNQFGPNYFKTKEFFRKFKQGQKDSTINALKNDQGTVHNTTEGILETGKKFYDDLYRKGQTDREKQAFFLNFIERKITDEQNADLNRQLETNETKMAIKITKEGGSPGLDGISIDFYKRFLHIILEPLTHVLNHFFTNAAVPYDIKISAISIIFKKGERNLMKNYRPISLSNNDVKILTKIMCERLKKYMGLIIGKSQYACPGQKITSPNHILRDLFDDADRHQHQHFIISVDFIKAFDSVDRDFMIKVLEKMGFEGRFLNTIKNLNSATGAKLIINGFISKTIKIRRGIKQGDALSLFLFLVALEPLILAINNHSDIRGIRTPGPEREISTCFADDLNVTLESKASLKPLMQLIEDFGMASGLKVHPAGNTKCCTCLVTGPPLDPNTTDLPPNLIYIRDGMEILGTAIGKNHYVEDFTRRQIDEVKKEALRIRETTQNFHERSVIANAKLLAMINFHTQFHGISNQHKTELNLCAKNFCLKNSATSEQFEKSTRDREHGGMSFPHISKFAEATILQQTFKYAKMRMEGTPLDNEMCFYHSNIGPFISTICNFPLYRNIRSTYPPSQFYQRTKDFIKFYKVTKEEILGGSLKTVKDRIRNGTTKPEAPNHHSPTIFQEAPLAPKNEMHNPIQSHKTITFNYRLQNQLLPLPGIHAPFGLPGASGNCGLCDFRRETEPHLFWYCDEAQNIWNVMGQITGEPFRRVEVLNMNFGENTQNKLARILLTSTTNYKIWAHRNRIKLGGENRLSLAGILKDIHFSIKNDLNFHSNRQTESLRTELSHLNNEFQNYLVRSNILPDQGVT